MAKSYAAVMQEDAFSISKRVTAQHSTFSGSMSHTYSVREKKIHRESKCITLLFL